jgi:hypothetical protein
MSNPTIYVTIEANFGWDYPTEECEKDTRHQQQHVLNAMALDLNSVVKSILEQMIFHRAKLDG